MKQSRRHELKTNELSLWLQQIYAAAVRNANYLIGGVVVVVLILVAAFYVQNRRHEAREVAWKNYYEFRGAQPSAKPEVMDQARRFAEEHADDKDLGPRAQLMVADLAATYALTLDPLKDKETADKRLALLKEARQTYTRVIDGYADQPFLVAQARMGLAPVLESLVLVGEAGVEDVRKQYAALQQMPEKGVYDDTVQKLADTLDDRLQPLKLVATRPAEPTATAPSTQAAPATQSVPASMPVAVEDSSPADVQPEPVAPPATASSPATAPAQ